METISSHPHNSAQDRLPGPCGCPCEPEFMWGTELQVEFLGQNLCSPRAKAKKKQNKKKHFFLVPSPNPTYFNI